MAIAYRPCSKAFSSCGNNQAHPLKSHAAAGKLYSTGKSGESKNSGTNITDCR